AGARPVPTRHYYDVVQLYTRSDDVRNSIASGEFRSLLEAAIDVSNRYFSAGLDAATLDLRHSPALNPAAEDLKTLRSSYTAERALYYRGQPSFDDILDQMQAIRSAL